MIKNISGKDLTSLQPTNETQEKKRNPKMLEAARGFENQFIRQLISEMRKTIPKDELIPESMTEDIFKEQLDGEYADSWVQNGGIGLADMIYDQLEQKYAPQTQVAPVRGEMMALPKAAAETPPASIKAIAGTQAQAGQQQSKIRDIFQRADKDLFLAKRGPNGFDIRSRDPLPEKVDILAPLSGVVLQAQALEGGKQLIVIKHDEGLVSQFIHTGRNNVKSNTRVAAGDVIAELPASQKGEGANVVFGLRKAADLE